MDTNKCPSKRYWSSTDNMAFLKLPPKVSNDDLVSLETKKIVAAIETLRLHNEIFENQLLEMDMKMIGSINGLTHGQINEKIKKNNNDIGDLNLRLENLKKNPFKNINFRIIAFEKAKMEKILSLKETQRNKRELEIKSMTDAATIDKLTEMEITIISLTDEINMHYPFALDPLVPENYYNSTIPEITEKIQKINEIMNTDCYKEYCQKQERDNTFFTKSNSADINMA